MTSRSLLIVLAAATGLPVSAADQEFYELRVYKNENAEKQSVVLEYVDSALIPALNRQGSKTIGVFTPLPKNDKPANGDVYVLIPFSSLTALSALNDTLARDETYLSASKSFMSTPLKEPNYQRIDSRLMKAFSGMPVLELPSKESADRILELRIYESHNAAKARLKVEMFNEGEIDIMRDVKLAPVFYGETLISNDVPNLTYMLSGDNIDVHRQHFKDFVKHPEWDRMKVMERYKGTVSKITSVMLEPAECSQI